MFHLMTDGAGRVGVGRGVIEYKRCAREKKRNFGMELSAAEKRGGGIDLRP
jgi:hypothetical protein